MPIPIAPASVSQNDDRFPISTAASTGMISNGIVSVEIPTNGAMKMPATPASAPPSPQVSVPRRCGDHPRVAAARGFSAVARTASPTAL